MNTTRPIYSMVRRHMKRTATFFVPGGERPAPAGLANEPGLVGWYENPTPWDSVIIAFTNDAFIIIEGDSKSHVPWDTVIDVSPPSSKTASTGLEVGTTTGRRFVRVAGRGLGGRTSDAYAFLNVVRAVLPPDFEGR